jgi:hypothetical protein
LEDLVRTNNLRLWQALLGSLVISSLACGGGSSKDAGGPDGGGKADGGGKTDVVPVANPDGPSGTIDLSPPSIDLAPAGAETSIDQTTTLPDGGAPRLDGAGDTVTGGPETLPDVPVQPDLLGTPDVIVKNDIAPLPDVPMGPDVTPNKDVTPGPDVISDAIPLRDVTPLKDVPPLLDVASVEVPPVLDVGVALDLPGTTDTQPVIDTSPAIDGLASVVDTGGSEVGLPTVARDKAAYMPGANITITFANASVQTGAWIGVFMVGAAETAYLDYGYTNGATAGTMTLPAPAAPGTYELRMFRDSGYTKIATSSTFIVVP